jgi:tRNA(Arg) A34 adenosine deaminase TadA
MLPEIRVAYPPWVETEIDRDRAYASREDRMRLVIRISRENVERGTGGPFGAAVFEQESGRLVAVGMNLVVPRKNSILHAEIVAFIMAEQLVGSHSLSAEGQPDHELHTSCDPCAMCLGATLWSGVKRIVCGALREDATALGFDEGPVFPESLRYLERRGVAVVRGVLRKEATAVLEAYRESGGVIYNG